MSTERLKEIVDFSYDRLKSKINGGCIEVGNEASLQLHLASILKTVGELYEVNKNERFSIELEKPVVQACRFNKSGSDKAEIDIFIAIENIKKKEKYSCAIEIKFFKKVNHREPNNRYDVFKDIHNLECYDVDFGLLIVVTDHRHYVNQSSYAPATADFDFRHGKQYKSRTKLIYKTNNPDYPPMTLGGSHKFLWDCVPEGLQFLKLEVLKD